jgi:cytochrome c-type biogenesis protein CcmF
VVLFLTGVGPLLAWRKSTARNIRDQFLWPTSAGVVTGVALAGLGVRGWGALACFALCAFVTGTVAQEFWRGANVRRRKTGTDLLTAMIGLVGRNKRRYGGYIAHLGIALMFVGLAGNEFKRDEQVLLKPGAQATVGHYTLRNDGVKASDDGQKQMVTGSLSLFEDGRQIDTLYPAKWFYRNHEEEATTEVAIRRGLAEDLYVVLPAFDLQSQTVTLEIVVNPLVSWIWFGFGVLALGTGIALLPEGSLGFALAKVPAAAVTGSVALLLALVLATASLSAQRGESPQHVPVVPRSAFEKQMQKEIMLTVARACALEERLDDELRNRE